MIFLVDYDNLGKLGRENLTEILEVIAKRIPPSYGTLNEKIACRLYGGWLYGGTQQTPTAKSLSSQINRYFPRNIRLSNQTWSIERPELAISLACDSENIFPDTYRTRLRPPPTNFKGFPMKECAENSRCPITMVNSFYSDRACVHEGCLVSRKRAFSRSEQKLVDTMIVSDLIHFATSSTKENLVLVSGDDDMWPGIRYALLQDARIIHILPKQSRRQKSQYRRFQTRNYTSLELSAEVVDDD